MISLPLKEGDMQLTIGAVSNNNTYPIRCCTIVNQNTNLFHNFKLTENLLLLAGPEVMRVHSSTYFFVESFFVRSNRSVMMEKLTRHTRPSSSRRAKCEGPTTMAFTGTRRLLSAEGTDPKRCNLSEIAFSLKKNYNHHIRI